MCGRFTLKTPMSVLLAEFGIPLEPAWRPRYNIAPTQLVAALRIAEPTDRIVAHGWGLTQFRWGLIPSWAKDASIGSRMINARSETVHEKPAFRAAFRRRPCLVLADGYYEWRALPAPKQPFHIRLKTQKPMTLAGLWERWEYEGNLIETCTLITTSANTLTAPIHDRMPVVIDSDDRSRWLDQALPEGERRELLVPYDPELMEAVAVSTQVNRVANDDPSCIDPIAGQAS